MLSVTSNLTYTIELKNDYNMKILDLLNRIKTSYDRSGAAATYDIRTMIDGLQTCDVTLYEIANDIFNYLDIKSMDKYSLIRYCDFTELYKDLTPEAVWSMYDGIFRECRTIVVDVETMECVIHGYDKFFNIGELEETSIENVMRLLEYNADDFEVSNKLDGSMVLGTCLENRDVMLVTSKSINPETSWRLKLAYDLMAQSPNTCRMMRDNVGKTFVFEMISSEDPHVVSYDVDSDGLYLIGCRDGERMMTYDEILSMSTRYSVNSTITFDMSLDEVIASRDDKKSDEAEGFVIRVGDKYFKVKYNDYVMMHKSLSGTVSPNTVIDMISRGTYDDFYASVPTSYKSRVDEIAKIVFETMYQLDMYVKTHVDYINTNLDNISDKMRYIEYSIPKILRTYVRNGVLSKNVSIFARNSKPTLNYFKSVLYLINETK